MSRRAMVVGGLMAVLLLTVIALDAWSEWKDLPSPGYVWRELRNAPGLLALAAFFFVIVFLVMCTWSVGLGRWGKVVVAVILAGAVLAAIGGYGVSRWTQYDWSGPVTSQRVDRFLASGQAFGLILWLGGVLVVAGTIMLTVVATRQTWQHRKQVFPFLYRSRE